jgi:hypothetical protein
MHIDYAATLIALKTLPEQDGKTDICKLVRWEINFFDTTYPQQVWSVAGVETILNTDTLSDSFVEFANLTQQQILQMALDQEGGDSFLDSLMPFHEQELLRKMALKDVEEKDVSEIQEQ